VSFHDITQRKKAESALRESEAKLKESLVREKSAARVDFLTGIFNRRGFYEIASSESQRSRRYKRPLSLVYVDIDNFKMVNDSMGHDAGDELLIQVAAVMHSEVRGTDTVGRLGGDEFAVLLPETDQENSKVVIQKLQTQLLELMQQKNWPVTFSIGLISFQTPPESIDEMVRGADQVMYSVKLKGKNSFAMQDVGTKA
jgi:diguanylate cyclase (GGDEF)-like protein